MILTAAALMIGLVGCANGEEPEVEQPAPPQSTPALESEPTETHETNTDDTQDNEGEAMSGTPIRIEIDGSETLESTLYDNPATQDLIDQLPLTLDFSDYGRQEVLAEPPQPLTMEGMPSGESAPAGTIGWYNPGGVVVLYYTDVGQYNGIVRIGEMDGDLPSCRAGARHDRSRSSSQTDGRRTRN